MKRFIIVLFLTIDLLWPFRPAAFAAAEVRNPSFSLTLPDGWVEIPQEVLSAMHAELVRQAPNANVPRYDCGFQLEKAKKGMEYPYVLVQVTHLGRLSRAQLESMPKIDMNEHFSGRAADFETLLTGGSFGKMQYDEAARIVWITTQVDVVGVGQVQGLSGLIPTEQGTVQFHGYALSPDFSRYAPVFRQIVASAVISPDLAYKPLWTDSIPLPSWIDPEIVPWIAGGIGAVAGILLVRLFRKRRKSLG